MLQVPVGPQIVLIDQRRNPVFQSRKALFVQRFQQLLADMGAFGHFMNDFLMENINAEFFRQAGGYDAAAAAGFSRQGDNGNAGFFFFALRVRNLIEVDLVFDNSGYRFHCASFRETLAG